MTTQKPSLLKDQAVSAAADLTLADVLARVPHFAGAPAQTRRNLASAIKTLARVLERPPALIPIAAPILRRLLAEASPGAARLKPSRWRNVKSEVARAIRLSGLEERQPKQPPELPAAWEQAALRGPTPTVRSALRRFARFCASSGLQPEQVSEQVVESYGAFLDGSQLSRTPARIVGDTVRAWNRYACADESLPKLTAPNRSRRYSVDWSDMPPSLAEDVAAFRRASLDPDLFEEDAPPGVRVSTADARDRLLRRILAAQLARGVPKAELTRLADVVEPERLKLALTFFKERNGGKVGQQAWDAAQLGLVIARHWAKLPEQNLQKLAAYVKKNRPKRRGLTEKNRARLRQFSDIAVIRALVALPDAILRKAGKMPVNARSAVMAQTALAIAILTYAPLRISNLVALDRERHLAWGFSAEQRSRRLIFSAAEVKNEVDLEYPLPEEVAELLELYFRKYQPLLTGGRPSGLFFPGRNGRPQQDSALRKKIVETIKRELGIAMNPHLFRHLSAMLYLKHHPGDYESPRRFLGHRNILTTTHSYAGLETTSAALRYDEVLRRIREGESGNPEKGK